MSVRAKRAVVSLAGTAALVAGLALWPSAAAAHPDDDGPLHREVVEGDFVTDREEESFIDNDGDALPSLGDELVYTDSGSSPFGDTTDYGHCVFHEVDLSANSTTVNCTATTEAERGSVTFQGSSHVGLAPTLLLEPATWAVTGGTGDFSQAAGEIHITEFEGAGLDFRTHGTVRLVLDGCGEE
jgi:hypothetical protein